MVVIPLSRKLKKKSHLEIALAQDLLIEEIYRFFPRAVIHGGTAIWRCFGSNRFSEDVDVYLPPLSKKRLNELEQSLKKKGFIIEKFKKTNGAVFSKFRYFEQVIRFEAVFKIIKNYITVSFESADGTFMVVNVLRPEDLIKEKVNTYLGRKKIRDLYDIFFLLQKAEDKRNIKQALKKLLENFQNPIDGKDLKTLIITGAVPKTNDMIREIEKWAR